MDVEKEFTTGEIEYSTLKSIFPKRPKALPHLEEVLEYFCRKNDISKEYKITKTSKGLIVSWNDKDGILLSQRGGDLSDWLNPKLNPYLGGNENYRQTSQEKIYELIGELKGKEINLEVEVSVTEDYEMKKDARFCGCCTPKPFLIDKRKRFIFRKDNERYWFLKKANIKN